MAGKQGYYHDESWKTSKSGMAGGSGYVLGRMGIGHLGT